MLKKILIFFLCLTFGFQTIHAQNEYKAINGKIDLKSWDLAENENIALDGEWEFYWQQLLYPSNFDTIECKSFFEVPNLWNKFNSTENLKSGNGYATFRIQIILPEHNILYGFKKGQIFSCSKIWINDQLTYIKGITGKNKTETVSKDYPDIFLHYATSDTIYITIQVSNFIHQKGGIKNSIIIGSAENIIRLQNQQTGSEYVILGILILIAISQIAMYFFHNKNIGFLLFGLACFCSIFVLLTEGEFILLKIFPNISQSLVYKIHYSVNYLRVPIFASFLSLVFRKEISRKIVKALLITGFISAVFTIATPSQIFTHSITFFMFLTLATLIYLLFGLVKAAIRKKEGSKLSLAGFAILFLTVINDVLNDRMLIQSFSMVSYGAAAFIIAQSTILSYRFSMLFKKNEKLSSELKKINENLEDLVIQRTAQIEQQKEEIESQAEYLANANHEIKHQNKILQIKNSEITQSINYALKIQTALLPTADFLKTIFPEHFIFFRPRDIVSGDFYWAEKIDNKSVIAAIDCTGHGVPGAFMSVLGTSLLNEIVTKQNFVSAAQTLEVLRIKIKQALNQTGKDNEQKDGMDMALCVIDFKELSLEYSGAYNPVYILRNNEINILEPDRQPISIHLIEKNFTNKLFKLQKNDCVYLFSDGFPDQMGGPEYKKFLIKNFKSLLININNLPLNEQYVILENSLDNWKGNTPQIDDILVIGIKI